MTEPQKIRHIVEKCTRHERITRSEGEILLNNADFLDLGRLAHNTRLSKHPDPTVTFVIDRNINYTDICVSACKFCAFFKPPGDEKGYVISKADLHRKIEETIELGGTQILLQGGMNPDLELEYYVDLLKDIKSHFNIHVHGFSPPEIDYIAKKSDLSVAKTLSILQEAGLDSVPGGGAEILCDDVRTQASPNKCTSDQWLDVMRQAHLLGMRTTATMMFGHLETAGHILEHLDRLRELQDDTHGFTAFIPWTFQPTNTQIKVKPRSAVEYLRVLAVSRIFLDNFDNIQASWVTQGDKIAQTALFYGANDMGSTMIEENVVASAGVRFMLPEKEIRRLIIKAGFQPRQRDCYYNLI